MKERYDTGHGDLEASLVLVFPVLLAYEVGVLFAGRVNGADVVTRALYATLGSRTLYLLLHAALAAMFLIWIRGAKRWDSLRLEIVAPVALEALIYALTLGAAITLVMSHLLGMSIGGSTVVSALGAGVHEELVFRLGLLAGMVTFLRGGGTDRRIAVVVAFALSAPLFALAHHAGANGEPFTWHAFAFRTFAGLAFSAIFWFRSLAHAVYAHALYDLIVAISS
ncbi:MAG TPA: CPBP family intramembrane glutamic endopeptidase [Kofleriaceae bacterium]|nr:CPBP family intramembrane glutamic endopeptidase [Kofleriaceae bacterium]